MTWTLDDAGGGWHLARDEWNHGRVGEREMLATSAIRARFSGLRLACVAEHAVRNVP
jgi:hypothetical protein